MWKSFAWFVVVTALAATNWSCSRPSPGLLELKSSREAIRAAKSWQSGTTAQFGSGQWVILNLGKVECPDRADRIAILHDEHNRSVHEIWYDGTYFNKSDVAREWVRQQAAAIRFSECGKGPSLTWDGTLYDDLEAVEKSGEFRRGKTDQADDVSCTWWEVAPAKGAAAHYSVCVGEDDHLPRTVRSHEHDLNYVYTLNHWNATTVILPPDATVRPF